MDYKEVASVLEELRLATDALFPAASLAHDQGELDFAATEETLSRRAGAVDRLGGLIARAPEVFTAEDLEDLQVIQSKGKRALESLLDVRKEKLAETVKNGRDQYFLRTLPLG